MKHGIDQFGQRYAIVSNLFTKTLQISEGREWTSPDGIGMMA